MNCNNISKTHEPFYWILKNNNNFFSCMWNSRKKRNILSRVQFKIIINMNQWAVPRIQPDVWWADRPHRAELLLGPQDAHSMMGADRSLVTVFLSRMWANGLTLKGDNKTTKSDVNCCSSKLTLCTHPWENEINRKPSSHTWLVREVERPVLRWSVG